MGTLLPPSHTIKLNGGKGLPLYVCLADIIPQSNVIGRLVPWWHCVPHIILISWDHLRNRISQVNKNDSEAMGEGNCCKLLKSTINRQNLGGTNSASLCYFEQVSKWTFNAALNPTGIQISLLNASLDGSNKATPLHCHEGSVFKISLEWENLTESS